MAPHGGVEDFSGDCSGDAPGNCEERALNLCLPALDIASVASLVCVRAHRAGARLGGRRGRASVKEMAWRRSPSAAPLLPPGVAVPGSLTWIGCRMNAEQQKVVQYLNEAEASERALVRVLQSQIAMTPRGSYRSALETHLDETRG